MTDCEEWRGISELRFFNRRRHRLVYFTRIKGGGNLFFFVVFIKSIEDSDDRLLFLFSDVCPIVYKELHSSKTIVPLFMSGFGKLSCDLGQPFLLLCLTSALLNSRGLFLVFGVEVFGELVYEFLLLWLVPC